MKFKVLYLLLILSLIACKTELRKVFNEMPTDIKVSVFEGRDFSSFTGEKSNISITFLFKTEPTVIGGVTYYAFEIRPSTSLSTKFSPLGYLSFESDSIRFLDVGWSDSTKLNYQKRSEVQTIPIYTDSANHSKTTIYTSDFLLGVSELIIEKKYTTNGTVFYRCSNSGSKNASRDYSYIKTLDITAFGDVLSVEICSGHSSECKVAKQIRTK